jgi:hypothetical protein
MSVGSWLLAGYVPATAALAGPAVATYTGALVADTAVPAWHDGHREMPLVFGASAATAAAGLGLLASPGADRGPVRRLGVAAAGAELVLARRMRGRMHPAVAAAYRHGRAGRFLRAAEALTAAGALAAAAGRRGGCPASGVPHCSLGPPACGSASSTPGAGRWTIPRRRSCPSGRGPARRPDAAAA